MSEYPFFVTFYSFKGGVGRSMAALNVAYSLAMRGRRVLLVDADLEAPGISHALSSMGELESSSEPSPFDVLDLFQATLALVRSFPEHRDATPEQEYAHWRSLLENLESKRSTWKLCLRRVKPEKLQPRKEAFPPPLTLPGGQLWVVAAELERDYAQRLAEAGVRHLQNQEVEWVGNLWRQFFRGLSIPPGSSGEETGSSEPTGPFEFVLIDARTGLTDLSALGLGPLADRTVMFSALNEQNQKGTELLVREVGLSPLGSNAKPEFDEWTRCPPEGILCLGPKPTLIVASPVPVGETALKEERLEQLRKTLGIVPLELQYHTLQACRETVFVRDHPGETLAKQYLVLADAVEALFWGDSATKLEKMKSIRDVCIVRLGNAYLANRELKNADGTPGFESEESDEEQSSAAGAKTRPDWDIRWKMRCVLQETWAASWNKLLTLMPSLVETAPNEVGQVLWDLWGREWAPHLPMTSGGTTEEEGAVRAEYPALRLSSLAGDWAEANLLWQRCAARSKLLEEERDWQELPRGLLKRA